MEMSEKIIQNIQNYYPPKNLVTKSVVSCPPHKTKIVILGQDPYHGPNQANGLAFAVNQDIKIPSSLRNILKVSKGNDRTLKSWSEQGVLLLNTILTVEQGKPNSHRNIGWQEVTKKIIEIVNQNKFCIFMLWGKQAQEYSKYIDKKHTILRATHPSGLSANKSGTKCGDPFMQCNHFEIANQILKERGINTIKWF